MRTKANHTYPLAYMHSGNQQYLPLGDAQIIQSLIQSIIPADFNGDGMLDVLVQSGIGGSLSSSTTIHFGDRTEFTSSGAFAEPADSSVHLLLMDYNLDMKPDLFGQAPNGTRVFWVNNGDGTFKQSPLISTNAFECGFARGFSSVWLGNGTALKVPSPLFTQKTRVPLGACPKRSGFISKL